MAFSIQFILLILGVVLNFLINFIGKIEKYMNWGGGVKFHPRFAVEVMVGPLYRCYEASLPTSPQ